MTTADRLNVISLGEAMFTQRAIRRFRTDPIPADVMQDIMQAAIRAPNGGNTQQWHFIVVQDEEMRRKLGELYHEAWWAKRADAGIMGPEDIPPGRHPMRSAMRLANEIGDAPVMVLVCAMAKGAQAAGSVIPAAQNMLLAARAFGIGGTIATLHRGGGGAGPRAVRHTGHGAGGVLHALRVSPGQLRAGDAAAAERGMQLRPVGRAAGLDCQPRRDDGCHAQAVGNLLLLWGYVAPDHYGNGGCTHDLGQGIRAFPS